MRRYWDDPQYYAQPSSADLKARAKKTTLREADKGKTLEPVTIKGRNITKTWWGNAWCNNLEGYADFGSRLERGRRYVRAGTVVDLKINKGKVIAKVQGSRKIPYGTEIRISPLNAEKCDSIADSIGGRISDLEDLMSGNIPDDLKEIFIGRDGLFPTPKEISFNCTCPDWALMCKHVAAVLYGIGNRFDEDPFLFFTLRGLDPQRFISITLENSVESMVAHADNVTSRCLDESGIGKIFGI